MTTFTAPPTFDPQTTTGGRLLDAALSYARAGWRVLPVHNLQGDRCSCGKPPGKGDGYCPSPAKHPRLPGWVQSATADESTIRAWWQQWPAANIGLATGGGAFALDFDDPAAADEFRAAVPDLARLLAWERTQSGGWHAAGQADAIPEGLDVLAWTGAGDDREKRIEFKGAGRQIVAAPSVGLAGEYTPVGAGLTDLYRFKADAVQAIVKACRALDLTPPPADPWKLQTLADAYTPRPPVEWIVEGLLPAASLTVCYGAPGAGKSFLLADMALAVATGRPWLPPQAGDHATKPRQVTGAPVLWVDYDNGQRVTADRFSALGYGHGAPADAPLYYVCPDTRLDAGNPQSVAELSARVLATNARLVVVDNLGLVSGAADENSADMVNVMDGLKSVVRLTGAAVVVVHHQRKGGAGGQRAGDALRGHGSIEAHLDAAVLVTRDAGEPVFNLSATKFRQGEVPPPFSVRLTWEAGLTKGSLVSARFYGVPLETPATKAADDLDGRILGVLAEGEKNVRDLRADVGCSASRLQERLAALQRAGKVNCRAGKRGALLYHLADAPELDE